jgi:membrane fusion protein (multidrug efflux system)
MTPKDKLKQPCGFGVLVIFLAMGLLPGCKDGQTGVTLTPPTVKVARVIEKDVPVYSEWTATTDGLVNATIRAEVQGYLIKQTYKEGDFVRTGQVLFEIDPRPFQAALEKAEAQLAVQRARWATAKADLERIRPLVAEDAVSKKDFDDAVGAEGADHAEVLSAQAAVDKARFDLEFTKITSPIDGVAGIARAQIGNLVGPQSTGELTTVSTVDPIKVYIPMSEQEYLRNAKDGPGASQRMSLELILADGSVYPFKGKIAFSDRQVDPRTGTITVAALFPNPGNILRPGQFARVRAETAINKGALLVPQRAVAELQGGDQVGVVGPDNRVRIRQVKVGDRIGDLWVIEKGLKPGDEVVVEGLQKVKEGSLVTPKPFSTEAAPPPSAHAPAPEKSGDV